MIGGLGFRVLGLGFSNLGFPVLGAERLEQDFGLYDTLHSNNQGRQERNPQPMTALNPGPDEHLQPSTRKLKLVNS